ncbi:hypothetical protein [Thiocapsa sp. N5-Cardenillas]|uniref:hypothetical protein n=1 Tax=Thiocapsa sp. N5-Cardenillas TaxID=3137397 RepID=UPI0035B40303
MSYRDPKHNEGIQPLIFKLVANQRALLDALAALPQNGTNVPVFPALDAIFPVTLADTASIDAFDRLRVSNPVGLFESTLTYDKQPLLWDEQLVGTGTSTYLPGESAAAMAVAATGDAVIRQTRDFFRYQPGKSQFILMTFSFGQGDPNVRRRIGYFDANNGLFLEEQNGQLWMVRRTNVSGVPQDIRIAQADWNQDKFDFLDPTKAQILAIDLEWLGVGRVRMGFVIDGLLRYAHHFNNANNLASVYMSTAQLPLRIETVAVGAPSAPTTMKAICGAVISEGGQEENVGFPFAVRNPTVKTVNVGLTPLLSIRPKATYGGQINRVQVIHRELEVFNAGNNPIVVDVWYNGTLTGAAFASADPSSVMEFDVAATAIAGGIRVMSTFIPSTAQSKTSERTGITGRLPIALDIDGLNPRGLTITAQQASGAATAWATMHWQEYR